MNVLCLVVAMSSLVLTGVSCGSADVGVHQPGLHIDGPVRSAVSYSAIQALRDSHPHLFACHSDDDCVAVPRGGCHNGMLDAVRKDCVDAYMRASKGLAGCPLILIQDERVARCARGTGECTMLAR